MNSVLAIDTATDACSVAWVSPTGEKLLVKDLPRAHNRHLLAMIDEILVEDGLDEVTHLVCGVGPGSFTGLRIATATVQGLAWPRELPVAGACSLLSQAEAAGPMDGWVLSTIDAQIDQLYGRWCRWEGDQLVAASDPWISKPEDVPLPDSPAAGRDASVVNLLGSGTTYASRLPVQSEHLVSDAEARPSALALARAGLHRAHELEWLSASALSPRYVQENVGWKKLSEQGRHD